MQAKNGELGLFLSYLLCGMLKRSASAGRIWLRCTILCHAGEMEVSALEGFGEAENTS